MPRILIAEDDADVREWLRGELIDAGYLVDVVPNGGEAVVLAAESAFDLFLLDMLMPGLDGLQTIRVLRKLAPGTPVLGLTGFIGRGYMAQAADLGVICLSKPVDTQDLLQEIRVALAAVPARYAGV
jgi:CheY-like chemotaxis protein